MRNRRGGIIEGSVVYSGPISRFVPYGIVYIYTKFGARIKKCAMLPHYNIFEMADEACAFYKRLASLLCDKWPETYAAVIGWLHCCLSFSLL